VDDAADFALCVSRNLISGAALSLPEEVTMDREKQIALIEQLTERREEMVREWKADAEFKAVLHRHDHIFEEPAPQRRFAR